MAFAFLISLIPDFFLITRYLSEKQTTENLIKILPKLESVAIKVYAN